MATFSLKVCIFCSNKPDFCYKSVKKLRKFWIFNLKCLFLQKICENKVFKL